MFASSSGNVSKYEFLTIKNFLPGKELLEKVATTKLFEFFSLDQELKVQSSFAENHYQGMNKLFNPKIKEKKTEIMTESKIVYENEYSFSDYKNVRKYSDLSLELSFYRQFY